MPPGGADYSGRRIMTDAEPRSCTRALGRIAPQASSARRASGRERTMQLGLLVCAVFVSVVLVFPSLLPPASYPKRSVSLELEAADIVAVDSTGLVGRYTSIAADSLGHVHISYYDSTSGDLKYATNADGSWDLSTIDRNGVVGWSTSIAVDAANKAHISYKDGTNQDLKYATNAGGSWARSVVDSEGDVGFSTSIAVDSGGRAHISYYDSTNGDLKYATNAGGGWALSAIDSEYDVGGGSSIAVDSTDVVHISYGDITRGYLKYATGTNDSWASSIVDGTCDIGLSTSLAVDAAGKVQIIYYDTICRDLKYATNVGGPWSVSTVDETGDVGAWSSMAVDPGGWIHVSYYDSTCHDLKYASNSGGEWKTSTIDSYDDVGMHTSIASDRAGRVHISYYDFSNAHLKYATFSILSRYEPAGLETGWNLISLPLVDYGYTASTLPGLSFGDMVIRWDSATQAYDRSYIFGISGSASDFDIEPNWAYWVYSSSARSIEILGYEPGGLQTRLIETPARGGWVQVGLATLRTDLWASDLADMYTADLLLTVHRWNADAKTYSSYIVGWDSTDFQLNPGDGLWLYVKGCGVLSYIS